VRHETLSRVRLDQIINMRHKFVARPTGSVGPGQATGWRGVFPNKGRPAEPARFIIGMFLLKYTYALSDEQVWDR
jgi:hypothetical protein